MPLAVIARVNLLGKAEPSLFTFTDRHGREIGDYAKDPELVEEDDAPVTNDFIEEVIPAVEITGVNDPAAESTTEPTGVEVEDAPEVSFEDGLGEVPQESEVPQEKETARQPTALDAIEIALPEKNTALDAIEIAPPHQGMAERNARSRKPPETDVPSMKGKKYAVAMTQIATSLGTSKNATALAQMSVKLLPKGQHRRADFVGMIMAQLSMKTAIKKWGEQAKFAISKDSYKPCNLHSLSKKQKEQILGSHIFVEQKRDGTIKAHKVIGGNRQRDYITKKDVSSPTVTAEAVMLTCVIDAQEGCDVAVVDIPNAFVQTVVSEDA
jgi:hypothetical protein